MVHISDNYGIIYLTFARGVNRNKKFEDMITPNNSTDDKPRGLRNVLYLGLVSFFYRSFYRDDFGSPTNFHS